MMTGSLQLTSRSEGQRTVHVFISLLKRHEQMRVQTQNISSPAAGIMPGIPLALITELSQLLNCHGRMDER